MTLIRSDYTIKLDGWQIEQEGESQFAYSLERGYNLEIRGYLSSYIEVICKNHEKRGF